MLAKVHYDHGYGVLLDGSIQSLSCSCVGFFSWCTTALFPLGVRWLEEVGSKDHQVVSFFRENRCVKEEVLSSPGMELPCS